MTVALGWRDDAGGGNPLASIVIPHLNQHSVLVTCLAALAQQNVDVGLIEIIVVDNGSRAPLDDIAAQFPDVTFLAEPQPGPGIARNRGIAAARGEIMLFIDADCRPHNHWIATTLAVFAGPEPIQICGGDVQIDVRDPAALTALEAYESIFAFRQSLYIARDGFSGTGNLAARRAVFDVVGPFGGIGIAEDRDWGQRAQACGFKTHYRPDMIVYHPARNSFEELTQKWRRHVAHDLAQCRQKRRWRLRWAARALLTLVSIVPHSAKILLSPRLSGAGNRLRAVGVLIRIRAFRCGEMFRQATATASAQGAGDWQRP
jgi:cellulose synthase/poly-beta-1,6-N-acetylglucosamine synthase-like glycosyltransferase